MRELLRSVWREPRSPGVPVRVRRDWALPAAVVVATVLEGLLTSQPYGLLGGTCEAGPAPGRGWTVTAALPRAGAAG